MPARTFHRHRGDGLQLRQDIQCLDRGRLCLCRRWFAGGETWQPRRDQSVWQRRCPERTRRERADRSGGLGALPR